MAFLRDWDETDPTDANLAREGAQEIRQLKEDVRERFNVEHFVGNADTSPFGMHKWVSRVVTGDYTISSSANDHVIYAAANSGNLTITLPDITDQGGRPIRIVRTDDNYIVSSSPRWVKVVPANGQTINGEDLIYIYGANKGIELTADEESGTGLDWKLRQVQPKLDILYHGTQSGTYTLYLDQAFHHFIEAGQALTLTISSNLGYDRGLVVIKNNNYLVTLAGVTQEAPVSLTQGSNSQDFLMLIKSFNNSIVCVGTLLNVPTS